MGYKKKTITLAVIALLLAILYIFYDLTRNIDYILTRRIIKVVAIMLSGGAIMYSTKIFMIITNNRILKPRIMEIISRYLLTQTFINLNFGSKSHLMMNSNINYLFSIGFSVLLSLL